MRAGEILALATRAGVDPWTRVLDLCCGPGGPGRLVVQERGCAYLGVDASPAVVELARAQGERLGLRHDVLRVPPLPPGPFDVVLLLETMLAFRDKETLLRQVRDALAPGGRFALTAEVGLPLTPAERAAMPAPDTVWPVLLTDLLELLEHVGLEVTWTEEVSAAHLGVVEALLARFTADEARIAAQVGRDVMDDVLTAHRLWQDWLLSGRVRKYALVARRPA
ncbi:class I SAM-dependent methyltransferase [Ornithinimicrobium avium]|uniref:Class I SAM-dependent methyltransferase n=2 Tax=Ornithinimicrobium avium TaxID=2283195 RepID=A0A345NS99_9MICO|nr:class I SAM-dependent methyltransferase [Ornithinimicrobium avium]